jgi:hypothetical protein
MNTVNFHAGRAFYQSSPDATITGWYFMGRGGRTYGPFLQRDGMQAAQQAFVKACVGARDTGGRASRRESDSAA